MRDSLTLRLPTENEEHELRRAHRAPSPEVPYFLHYYSDDMRFRDYLAVLADQRRGVNLPPNHLPSTFLFAFVGGRIVGRVAIRHSLNEFLERVGGHIIHRVLVTCDDDNLGSIRTIEKNGGQLENVITAPDLEKPKRRYWIVTGHDSPSAR